jgi:hypothetical protein
MANVWTCDLVTTLVALYGLEMVHGNRVWKGKLLIFV